MPKVRVVYRDGDDFVTTAQLQQLGKELKSSMFSSIKEIKAMRQLRQQGKSKRDMTRVECYNCHEYWHFARGCPSTEGDGTACSDKKSGNC